MEFWIFIKSQFFNSYKAAREVTEEPWNIFDIFFSARCNSMTKICFALSKCEYKPKICWEKILCTFEVHSNEIACRKSGRLGMDLVTGLIPFLCWLSLGGSRVICWLFCLCFFQLYPEYCILFLLLELFLGSSWALYMYAC